MKPVWILAILTLMLLPGFVLAADFAKILQAVPAPDPVKAGDTVNFQAVIKNVGNEGWKANEYVLQAEVYSADRKLLLVSPELTGPFDTAPGETALMYIPFDVPQDYGGKYLFKITLTHNGKRILTTEYYPFNVGAPTAEEEEIPPVSFSGNLLASYRNSGLSNYLGNVTLNMMGRIYDKTVSFNSYADYDKTGNFQVSRLLLSYYDTWGNIQLGDITPDLSTFTLSSILVRGGYAEGRILNNQVNLQAVAARSQIPKEGSLWTSGAYARYLYGGRASWSTEFLGGEAEVGGSATHVYDDRGTIKVPGPGLMPVVNDVTAVDTTWKIPSLFKLTAEYAQAQYNPNTVTPTSILSDAAFKVGTTTVISTVTLNAGYRQVGTEFISLGSPSFMRDRAGIETALQWNTISWLNCSALFNQYKDNLKGDPQRITTTNSVTGAGVNVMPQGWPLLGVGYNVATFVGSDANVVNNTTNSMSASLSYVKGNLGGSGSYSLSNFADMTRRSHDLNTSSMNVALNSLWFSTLSLAGGATNTLVSDVTTSNKTTTTSVSVNTNYQIVPNEYTVGGWASQTLRADDLNLVKNTNMSWTVEGSYLIPPTAALTVGYTVSQYTDEILPAYSYADKAVSLRLNVVF